MATNRFISPRMIQGAHDYALADNSDPFALSQALCHLRNGVASLQNQQGQDAFYNAEAHPEQHSIALPDGKVLEWTATSYRSRVRP